MLSSLGYAKLPRGLDEPNSQDAFVRLHQVRRNCGGCALEGPVAWSLEVVIIIVIASGAKLIDT